jgi:heme-degrading monooxygenase HmoA
MYAVLRRIHVQPQFVEESVKRMEYGLVPLLRKEPGFVEIYVILVGEGVGVSISIFETGQDAEEGNRRSLEWAREQIFPLALGPAEIIGVGEILLHQTRALEEEKE